MDIGCISDRFSAAAKEFDKTPLSKEDCVKMCTGTFLGQLMVESCVRVFNFRPKTEKKVHVGTCNADNRTLVFLGEGDLNTKVDWQEVCDHVSMIKDLMRYYVHTDEMRRLCNAKKWDVRLRLNWTECPYVSISLHDEQIMRLMWICTSKPSGHRYPHTDIDISSHEDYAFWIRHRLNQACTAINSPDVRVESADTATPALADYSGRYNDVEYLRFLRSAIHNIPKNEFYGVMINWRQTHFIQLTGTSSVGPYILFNRPKWHDSWGIKLYFRDHASGEIQSPSWTTMMTFSNRLLAPTSTMPGTMSTSSSSSSSSTNTTQSGPFPTGGCSSTGYRD